MKVALRGVIDADYRSDDYLTGLREKTIHILDFHEAESYLCLPDVLCAVADRIGSQEHQITEDDVRKEILARLKASRLAIAARRVFARTQITLGLSLERKIMSAVGSRDALLVQMKMASESELQKAHGKMAPEQIEQLLDAELEAIDEVIANQEIERALRLIPAKELLSVLSPKAGCRTGSDLMRALRRNFKPDDFPATKALSAVLENGAA